MRWQELIPLVGCKFNGGSLFLIKRGPPGWRVIISAITGCYNLTAFKRCCWTLMAVVLIKRKSRVLKWLSVWLTVSLIENTVL